MQPKVEAYLSSVEKKIGRVQSASREEILKSAGLVEKEYGTETADYVHTQYDNEKKLYYTEKVMSVSDEEFEAVKRAYDQLRQSDGSQRSNGVASMLRTIAILTFIGGFILGIVMGRDFYGDYVFKNALVFWAVAWVSGSMVLGFAEEINLLQGILTKQS